MISNDIIYIHLYPHHGIPPLLPPSHCVRFGHPPVSEDGPGAIAWVHQGKEESFLVPRTGDVFGMKIAKQ